jgi:hypothetical protein
MGDLTIALIGNAKLFTVVSAGGKENIFQVSGGTLMKAGMLG